MPTDDERRIVAKELRDFFPIDLVSELTDVDCHLASMVMGDKFCPSDCLWCFETVCSTLADLIEPGESRHESGQNQDSVQKESPAVPKAPECDREALLALADEITESYVTGGADGDELVMSRGAALFVARRSREALGVGK